jgi:hypothetical protein
MRLSFLIVLALAAAGCATLHDRGWQGSGAEPFDGAKAACEAEAAAKPEGAARTEAFEACMAAKGWRRP